MQWAILIGLAWRRERGVGRGRNGYLLAPLSGIQRTRDRRTLVPPVRPKNAPDRRHGTHQTRERSVFYIPMHPNASPAWIVLRRLEGWPCGRQRQANIYQRPAPENLHHIKRNEVNPMRRIVLLALAAIGLVRGGRGQRLYQGRHSGWYRGTLCGTPRFSRRSVGMYLGPSYCQTACTCAFNKVGAPTGCDENAKVSKGGRRGREQRRLARNRKYLFAWRAHGLTATSLEEVARWQNLSRRSYA